MLPIVPKPLRNVVSSSCRTAPLDGISPRWFEQVEGGSDFITLIDALDRVHYVNSTTLSGAGAGESVYRFADVEYHDVLRDAVALSRSTGLPQQFYSRAARLRSASVYSNWVVALRGTPIEGLVALISTDVTEQSRIEAELELIDLTLRSLIENSPDSIVIVDRDRRIKFVNRLFSGMDMADVIGAPAEDFVPEADRRTVVGAVEQVLATGEPFSYSTGFTAGGIERRFDTRVVPIPGDNGIDRLMLVATDVTAQFELDQENERLESALRQAQKMNSLGQLTGGVAHDFNNILVAIRGNLELAQVCGQDHVERDARIAAALEAAEHAKVLTERLLAFSRKQTLRPRPVDIGELVAGMRELLIRSLGETFSVHVETAERLRACKVDPAQLESAVLNLAVNARDAMPEGGDVHIRTSNVDVVEVDSGGVPPGRYVRLEVADGGVGMTPDVVAQACEPFFTTKGVGLATGLGLSMVYGFVLQSGGFFRILSEPGEGTTVQIYLLETLERCAPPPAPEHTPGVVSGGREVVLVVEDNDTVRSLTAALLGHLGYRTVEAEHAEGALGHLAAEGDIDLMITDVVLPGGVDGFELADRARISRPALPILFVSGYPQDVLARRSGHDETDVLLMKPFTTRELADAVSRQLADAARGPGSVPV